MIWIIIISVLILISAVIIICVNIYYRRKISAFSKELCQILDDITAENPPDFTITEDTLDGKINVKLKRIPTILRGRYSDFRA